MTFCEMLPLIFSRLMIRKKRTIVTVLTASVLFGVILAAIFIFRGIHNVLLQANRTAFGDTVYLQVRKIYADSGPEGEWDRRISGIVESSGGHIVADLQSYAIIEDGLVQIDKTSRQDADDAGRPSLGKSAIALSRESYEVLRPLIEVTERRDDVIQILIPFRQAVRVAGLSYPSSADSASVLSEKIAVANKAAVGKHIYGSIPQNNVEVRFEYEIVGVLPPKELLTFRRISPTFFEGIVAQYVPSFDRSDEPFIVVNPDSAVFQNAYDPADSSGSAIVAFDDVTRALSFARDYACFDNEDLACAPQLYAMDFLGDRLGFNLRFQNSQDAFLTIFIVATVVAVVVMAGTINRVMDDERESIALYRSIGASSCQVNRIFLGYTLVLGLLTLFAATVCGLVIASLVTVFSTAHISANIGAYYNLSDFPNAVFIGYDPHVVTLYAVILATSATCIVFVMHKLASRDLSEDLRG